MVEKVVSEITAKFDEVLRAAQRDQVSKGLAMTGSGSSGGCGCGPKYNKPLAKYLLQRKHQLMNETLVMHRSLYRLPGVMSGRSDPVFWRYRWP